MGLFVALRTLYPMQNFIALVDSWPRLLLASRADRVVEVADDAPIPEMQLRRAIKESHDRHRRLLRATMRARPKRPRRRCAAEKGDELASFHVWMAPAWQEKM
jgi:hypothetical protein